MKESITVLKSSTLTMDWDLNWDDIQKIIRKTIWATGLGKKHYEEGRKAQSGKEKNTIHYLSFSSNVAKERYEEVAAEHGYIPLNPAEIIQLAPKFLAPSKYALAAFLGFEFSYNGCSTAFMPAIENKLGKWGMGFGYKNKVTGYPRDILVSHVIGRTCFVFKKKS